jgi:aspartate kinase
MKVFKFGGASVKDAAGVRNIASIIRLFPNDPLLIVVSAMGKTTNALEAIATAYFYKKGNAATLLKELKEMHWKEVQSIIPDKNNPVYDALANAFLEIEWAIEDEPTYGYDHEYDQIVSMGEVLASHIVSAYLNQEGIINQWKDARDFIQTDNSYREGKVNWELTVELLQSKLVPLYKTAGEKPFVAVTQGFIGGTSENFTTTLGREGSDYTAAIIAYGFNAESVTIWKDVPGVLNADPKWFDDTMLIEQLSYQDAIELAYYGATVIHPKTIKPLQNKNIPLFVKSFLKPAANGTLVNDKQMHLPIPCFIFKINQVLLSISPKDFSFIVEDNLSEIFRTFADMGIKINLMANSAISFSICVDQDERKLPPLIRELQKKYRVLYNENAELITIRYYNQSTIDRVCEAKKILLEQKSRYTIQLVVQNQGA